MVELLAPAGTKEAFLAAVENGANAVYLAGKMFGARAYASNFDEDELAEVIRHAHLKNVQVHVAVNTIVDSDELPQLKEYLSFLYDAGADAVLLQDLGAVRLAKQVVPRLPLHASTQMTVHNLAGVRALEELGFSRVVLARELSIAEIRHICAESRIEIESFVHGALCVCYSGQCLMSSMIGGRSGNRGRCAQPCRLPYTLVDADGKDVLGESAGNFLLSPRDLNTIELIPQLLDAGIDSLKIEGRMKRPEYVATIVHTYRKAIDHHLDHESASVDAEDRDHLAQVFNRDFTTAYMEKPQGKYMMSDRRPNNRGLLIGRVTAYDRSSHIVSVKLSGKLAIGDQVDFWVKVGGRVSVEIEHLYNARGKECREAATGDTVSFPIRGKVHVHDRVFKVYDAKLMDEARRSYDPDHSARIPIRAVLYARLGEQVHLHIEDDAGNAADSESDYVVAEANNRPLTVETVQKQMGRLGTTIFSLAELVCEMDESVMVPVSELNNLRRSAIASIEEVRMSRFQQRRSEAVRLTAENSTGHMAHKSDIQKPAALMVAVDDLAAMKAAVTAGADGILYGGESLRGASLQPKDYAAAWDYATECGVRIDYNTPRIVRGDEQAALIRLFEGFGKKLPSALHVHHIGTAYLARDRVPAVLHADYSMISYNPSTLAFLRAYGFGEATLSPELNGKQMERLAGTSPIPLTALVSGRLPLMISEYCVLGSFLGNLDTGKCSMPCRRQDYYLRDRKGVDFPVMTDQFCRMHILNSKQLSLLPYVQQLLHMGVKTLRIEGRGIPTKELQCIVRMYRTAMQQKSPIKEEDEQYLRMQEGNDITRGHYFRGIL
ncbi:peptidase U32 [Selenomonas sp. oral taxon 126]|uniref:DUF3656 domain-containing U32 family peptidase n=1 Tax=Selenomonas sp. oral taxon 126 TaxID=712528 RepID=UPI0008078122|nr:U32 family peptidase [Selenomonas sp. oral taxon 126]ANR71457.1 peptidase U32 [Selenomonas sp. oral taxon 126]